MNESDKKDRLWYLKCNNATIRIVIFFRQLASGIDQFSQRSKSSWFSSISTSFKWWFHISRFSWAKNWFLYLQVSLIFISRKVFLYNNFPSRFFVFSIPNFPLFITKIAWFATNSRGWTCSSSQTGPKGLFYCIIWIKLILGNSCLYLN